MRILIPVVMLSALAFFGCSNTSAPSTSATTFFPLNQGEYWAYSISTFDSVGALISIAPDTLRVVALPARFGPSWQTTVHSKYIDTEYYSLRSDGVWRRDNYAYYPTLIHKYPTNPGDTFSTTFDTTGLSYDGTYLQEFYRTIAVDEQVTVPAGTFSCIHYDWIWQQIDRATSTMLRSDTITEALVARATGMVRTVEHTNTYDINGIHPRTTITSLVSH